MQTRSSLQPIFVGISFLLFSIMLMVSYGIVTQDEIGVNARLVGITIMLVSLGILLLTLGDKWRSSIGFMHLLALFAYHGVGELMYIIFPYNRSYFVAAGVSSQSLADAAVLSSIGMLCFALGYAITIVISRNKNEQHNNKIPEGEHWRQLLGINLPFVFVWVLISLVFRAGVNNSVNLSSSGEYWTRVILLDVFVPLVALFLMILKAKHTNGDLSGTKFLLVFLPVVVVTVLLANTRQDVIIILMVFLFMSNKLNIYKTKLNHLLIGMALIVPLFIILAGFRGEIGRHVITNASLTDRIEEFVEFVDITPDSSRFSEGYSNILLDLGYRLNANVFLANAHSRRELLSIDTIDFGAFTVPPILMVPSFIWPQKLFLPVHMRNVETYLEYQYGIRDRDYLLTPLAVFYMMGGTPTLIIFMLFLGIAVALIDGWLARPHKLWVIILGVGIVTGLAWVEHDITDWFVRTRAGLVLAIVICTVSAFRFKGLARFRTNY